MGSLDGKVAIVTGAARGIGKGMATALAKQGAAVTITDVLEDTLETTKNELEKSSGARVLALVADGRKEDVVKNVVRQTVEQFGRIDLLINNAQTDPNGIPLEKHTAEGLALALDSGFYAAELQLERARRLFESGSLDFNHTFEGKQELIDQSLYDALIGGGLLRRESKL